MNEIDPLLKPQPRSYRNETIEIAGREVAVPITDLDRWVLGAIEQHGNVNGQITDPYTGKSTYTSGVNERGYGNAGQLNFGKNYLVHVADALPKARMTASYHADLRSTEVAVDIFDGERGLKSRTVFSDINGSGDIYKSHKEKILNEKILLPHPIMLYSDFSRPADNTELHALQLALQGTDNFSREVDCLVRITLGDAERTRQNITQARQRYEEHRGSLQSIIEAQRAAPMNEGNIYIG